MTSYSRVCAVVDLNVVRHNILKIVNNIPKGAFVMPVIKADAYGHGSVEVANAILDISYGFCVATIEEALELRSAGIKKPVLILGTLSSEHFEEAVLNDISVNIYTEDMAKKLSIVCEKLQKTASVHISVDTGMNRIGLPCNKKGTEEAVKIASFKNLSIDGIFSHFATADKKDKTMANLQSKRFADFYLGIKEKGINPKFIHISNSAAICDFENCALSLVRPGIIIYGYYPSDEVSKNLGIEPAMELKTRVSHIKQVEADEGISYGHTYVTKEKRTIATIPVGYADGYPRLLSNKGRVIINGFYAQIVGRVCMDQFMVDVTDIPNVSVEDEVILIGSQGDKSVTADDIAKICGTISYEILCGISKRVPRIYKNK